ncbi:hypothetical protein KQX54_005549 [Cotesia glomerata]|uniref:Uncharacterized protein n=1 Tax=Cotesia glomerata TaxID=32391 RepID=A0AAV7HTY6_COTGL|nr:hypothetical protein KQX54_005549 [Cotesia glomerata]
MSNGKRSWLVGIRNTYQIQNEGTRKMGDLAAGVRRKANYDSHVIYGLDRYNYSVPRGYTPHLYQGQVVVEDAENGLPRVEHLPNRLCSNKFSCQTQRRKLPSTILLNILIINVCNGPIMNND